MKKHFRYKISKIEMLALLMAITSVLIIIIFRYDRFKCRAMESEAKFHLQDISNAQLRYHAEHDRYASLSELIEDKRIALIQRYFLFKDKAKPSQNSYSIIADGVKASLVEGEQWSVDQSNEIKLVKSVCKAEFNL